MMGASRYYAVQLPSLVGLHAQVSIKHTSEPVRTVGTYPPIPTVAQCDSIMRPLHCIPCCVVTL